MQAREALKVAMLAETQLERARRGDQEIAAALLKEFGRPLTRTVPLATHEERVPVSSKKLPQASPDLPPRPRKPPYLNYDSQKNPFFRPRVHNQSQAMMMASRLKQTQHRHDRSDNLHYQAMLASTEDQFYQALSMPGEVGWHAEVKLARAVLHEQMKQASVRQSELWDILEEEHEDRWRRYREDMEEYTRQRRARFVQRAQQS
ncbi:hypothetical protein BCR37DRAFT_387706 [Protomyces lactucae-debilis]|uniref:Uncharacterized protein n=1 Tax=Protomyces lactucae-debilis TaxID=2754530 RepID=A0A1Y2FCT1_PROLT|nr:uncharacterized protein BCR37DRAFT_387706 [Protomyces lactucae-debilis]ORY81427.1 hypothetical protein BCR37DRAFT_387706 [Protomyces lactucae-debilis]